MTYGRAALALLALLLAGLTPADADGAVWESWRHIPGVFDVVGPRSDGRLLVAGSGRLFLVDTAGTVVPFASGPGGYADDAGAEAYVAVSPGQHVAAGGCDFAPDDAFVLRLHQPYGVTRVAASGTAQPFAAVAGVESLNGIAFDTTGKFDHRLLVSGPVHGRTAIVAIDCRGRTQVITDAAPVLEGGLAVAPLGFGAFGGALVAPDELSGRIYAIDPDGNVRTIAGSGLATGGDIGIESVGFVPSGFTRAGKLYYADRATANNPHPGTDSLLRLDAHTLTRLGVRDGDMLAATEGGATMIAVHCTASCSVTPIIGTPTTAHGEGHLLAVAGGQAAGPAAAPSTLNIPLGAAVLVVAVGAAAIAAVAIAWRRR
jgi:hypothetical protein